MSTCISFLWTVCQYTHIYCSALWVLYAINRYTPLPHVNAQCTYNTYIRYFSLKPCNLHQPLNRPLNVYNILYIVKMNNNFLRKFNFVLNLPRFCPAFWFKSARIIYWNFDKNFPGIARLIIARKNLTYNFTYSICNRYYNAHHIMLPTNILLTSDVNTLLIVLTYY